MDAEVLAAIARLPESPQLHDAYVIGFRTKLLGLFPALVPAPVPADSSALPSSSKLVVNSAAASTMARGKMRVVHSEAEFARLRAYEGSSYAVCGCQIHVGGNGDTDSGVVLEGQTFCWAGDADSAELTEGVFDFERYQKTIKPLVLKAGRRGD